MGALGPKLPFLFPVAADLPPSAKSRYRSHYQYLGYDDLLDATVRANLSDFEISLRVIDYAPLTLELARLYVQSAKGQVPFHPVSMLLACCLRRELNLGWRKLARLLAGEHGVGWRRLLGFDQGQTPSASGLRHFYRIVGPGLIADLCARSIDLLHEQGLLPEHSTFPGDPPERGVTLIQDGMLHEARHQDCCHWATDECYRPLSQCDADPADTANGSADESASGSTAPTAVARRVCRAKEKGFDGCACDTPDCEIQCRQASRLDPEARFIHYDGHNNKHASAKPESSTTPSDSGKDSKSTKNSATGKDVFGCRDLAERIIDDRFSAAWTLASASYSANTDERTVFCERLDAVETRFLWLRIGEVIADSANGYGPSLNRVFELGALRMIDIREDPSDRNWEACLQRGYDGKGRPLCVHGYAMRSNGYDSERRRAKYICAHVCEREPRRQGEPVQPVSECPFREPTDGVGQVVNVGRTLPDGSLRLAREIPYGSDTWKARYGRRNLTESRNAQMEQMGLKRMPVFGGKGNSRNIKEVQIADFLINLHTIGRLIREATDKQQA